MATVQTNIVTLAMKSLLIGATLTLQDDTVIIVDDYEYDPSTKTFKLEAGGDVYPVASDYIGTASNTGLTKPSGNRKFWQKLKRS